MFYNRSNLKIYFYQGEIMDFDKTGNLAFISKVIDALKGKWIAAISSSLILAFLVFVVSDFLQLIPVVGVPVIGFALLGEIAFMRNLLNNQTTKLEDLFAYYKQFIPAFLTTALLVILLTVGFALLIVPGILVLVNYSFALHILQENPQVGSLQALRDSSELTKGYRTKIAFFYFIFFLITVVVFGISLAISLVPNLIWGTNLILYASILAGVLQVLFISPVFYAAITQFYDSLKNGDFEKAKPQKKKELEEEIQEPIEADEIE
jgi:uncharacterized membrane protein